MAQSATSETGNQLIIEGRYHNTLDIEGFSKMMKDPSFCYKFYWLEAIVQLISEGIRKTTFDEIIDEMICNAWYSVREFHIHLSGLSADGQVRDGLERAVLQLTELSGLPSDASKTEIRNAIAEYNRDLAGYKKQLTNMVPGRALAGFFAKSDEKVPWGSAKRLTEYVRHFDSTQARLPYIFGDSSSLKKEVRFNEEWMRMIQDNTVNILGWIQFEKVRWLQNNNPEVPGLVYKLTPIDEKMRKLNRVRRLWEGIIDVCDVRDVFTGRPVAAKKYDIDHFIPWSFVMNDELWNLMPMDSSLNSSKSNKLPKWNPFFDAFSENQYLMYQMIQKKDGLHKLFEACYRDNLHSDFPLITAFRMQNPMASTGRSIRKDRNPSATFASRINPASHAHRAAVRAVR